MKKFLLAAALLATLGCATSNNFEEQKTAVANPDTNPARPDFGFIPGTPADGALETAYVLAHNGLKKKPAELPADQKLIGTCKIQGPPDLPCQSVLFVIKNNLGAEVGEIRTDVNGQFTFRVSPGSTYFVEPKSASYEVQIEPKGAIPAGSDVTVHLSPKTL